MSTHSVADAADAMRYRPHIDGLRAVAVLPVVLYHVDFRLAPGGFTGVDIFFVISGFLITSLIVKEIAEGRFSFLGFYKRRALRILPAYFAMIAVTLIATWPILFPEETRAFGRSLIAASLFVSNIYFWQTSSYFDPDVETAPLLHTWTLSVEEQFYLGLPVFLILVWRLFGGRFAVAILAVTALSFAANLWETRPRDSAAFYLLPARAWEFGLGGLVAVTGLGAAGLRRSLRPGLRMMLACAGIALIGWGFVALDKDSLFPGVNAVFPALGAMLVIAFAEDTPIGTLLSTRPAVAVGRISYSVYLWHWPLVVFWRMEAPPMPDWVRIAALVGLSLALGAISFALIEQPFRQPAARRIRPAAANIAALASLATAAVTGALVAANADRWGNLAPRVRDMAGYIDYRARLEIHPCFIDASVPGQASAFDPEVCLSPDRSRPTILFMGDSFSEHFLPAVSRRFPDINFQLAASSGCRPVVGLEGDWYCPQILRSVLEEHVPDADLDMVVLSARWMPKDLDKLKKTVDYLTEHVGEVVVLGRSPEYVDSFPRLLARNMRRGEGRESLEQYLEPEARAVDARMRRMDWGSAEYISLYDLVCPDECRLTTKAGVPIFADYGHFTRAAALEIVDKISRQDVIRVD